MVEGRPHIPAELEREILVEAGHRCAIPTCRQIPVQIDHIRDWAKVREHRAENLIALCPNCHARKTRGEIDVKAMLRYKAQLKELVRAGLQMQGDVSGGIDKGAEPIPVKRILILEDDPTTLRMIEHILIGDGYQTFGYENGQEALGHLEIIMPNLIITDMMMPELNGEAFCREVRANDRFRKVPILVITARDTSADKYAMFNTGAEDFIAKPFDSLELLYRVRAFLRLVS